MMVLAHLTYTGSRFTLQLYALKLTGSAYTVGVLMSLLAVVPMFMSVHTGRWTDRIGPVRPALLALSMLLTGALLPPLFAALASTYLVASLYVASVLIGSGFMIGHIAVNNAVGSASTPQNRTQVFSQLALGFSTSSMVGPVAAGFAIDRYGHAWTFVILAASTVGALLTWTVVRRRMPRAHAHRPPPGARLLDLLRLPALRAVFVVSGMMSMAWDLFTFMVPLHGTRSGLSASTIGIIVGSFGVATFVVRAAIPAIMRRFSEWQTLTGAMAITACVYFCYPLFHTAPVLIALAFVLGLGLGCSQPMVMTLLHLASPPGRSGESVGVRTTIMNASQTFLPLVFSVMGASLGVIPAFWMLASFMSAGGWFAGRRKGSVL
jgi:predicted MFS family arabinose efflux permease